MVKISKVKTSKVKKNVQESKKLVNETTSMLLKRPYVVNAVKKLQAAIETTKQSSKQLFEETQTIYMQLTVVKIPKCDRKRMAINLKHSIIPSSGEILLITPDLKNTKKTDYEQNVEFYSKLLDKHNIKNVKEIMPLHKLNANYKEYEMQRRLMGLFDFIICESSVLSYVMKKIGNAVKKSTKPIGSIRLVDNVNLKKMFDKMCLQTHLQIHPNGDTFTASVGHSGLSTLQLTKNIMAFANEIAMKFPGGFDNVRSLHIKTALSKSILFYLSAIHSSDIKVPVAKLPKAKTNVTVSDTLSTMMDGEVKVLPHGDVIMKKMNVEEDE